MAEGEGESAPPRRGRDRCTDNSLVAKAANNAVVTLLSRGAMIVVGSLGLVLGGRFLAQLDQTTAATTELAKNVAVISVTVNDMVERVRGLENRERSSPFRAPSSRP